jgi:transcriptional regulator with XRE-family HTH domain
MSIGTALRAVRRSLGLTQADVGARVLAGRETVSAWERDRWEPTHQQRVRIVESLADAPPDVLAPLVQALGVAAPRPLGRAALGADATARASAAIRAAADQLDVPASTLRRTLAVAVAHLDASGVSLEDAAAVLRAAP